MPRYKMLAGWLKESRMQTQYGNQNILGRLQATARACPDHLVIDQTENTAKAYDMAATRYNYAEMAEAIDERMVALAKIGLSRGERVGLYLYNRPEFFIEWMALNGLGLSIVPINPDLRTPEVLYLIEHSGIRLMIHVPESRDFLAPLCAKYGCAMALPLSDLPEIRPTPAHHRPAHHRPTHHRKEEETSQEEAALLYTSGTTGLPKGCILTNEYFLCVGDWYASLPPPYALEPGRERMITPLPLFHMNPLAYSFMSMVTTGGCLLVLDRFHPKTWCHCVRESRATILHYLGVMPSILMKLPPSGQDRDHHIRFGLGAGVDGRLHAGFEERFGFPLLELWAMTETGAGAVISAYEGDRHVGKHCFGRAPDTIETRIVDDNANRVQPGEAGELLVRRAGDNPRFGFFRSYLKNDLATEEAWEGNWFHTGDVVRQGTDGALFFCDRKKNIIRRSGENIAAFEVESVLGRSDLVASVAVGAVDDDIREEEVACLVVRAPDCTLADRVLFDRLLAHCQEILAYYKQPGWFARVESLPLTGTQKLQRGALKRQLSEMMREGALTDLRARKKRQSI